MISRSFRVALSALLFAGALGLASTGPVQAQSIMKQCGDDWKAAKENNTTNGMDWPELPEAMPRPERRRRGASRSSCRRSCSLLPLLRRPRCKPTSRSRSPCRPLARLAPANSPRRREAKGRCGNSVVWVNTKGKSHTYHYAGSRWYGTTKQGAYMCEADAGAAGYHASKSKTEQQKQM